MKTTFSRTLLMLAILLLASLLLVGISFQFLAKSYLERQAIEGLKADASILADVASAYYSKEPLTNHDFLVNLALVSRVSDSDAVICDATGQLVLCSDAPTGCEHQGLVIGSDYLKKALSQKYVTSTGRIQGLYDDARYVVSTPFFDDAGNAAGIVIVSTPLQSTLMVLTTLSDTYLTVSLIVVLICAVVVLIYARNHSAPLRQMSKAAIAFGHGQLDARVNVPPAASQEVTELALAFNNMAASLEKSEYQHKEFVANVSHELKTPMTTIGGYIDGILDGTIPPEKQAHYLQIVSDETKRLSRLVRSMLDISRLQEQGGIPEDKKSRFDICESIGQVLITFEKPITQKDLNIQVELPEHPLFTRACQDHITQVIYNLLDNAVKFCPQAGNLEIKARAGGNKIYVSISNDGPTIPPEELSLLFDRFHKLDKSRSQNRDGWGLGLYIVKTIVCSHGEDISVTSREGKTQFTFTLPLVN